MTNAHDGYSARSYAEYIGNSVTKWSSVLNRHITHKVYGDGTITAASINHMSKELYVLVKFHRDGFIERFSGEALDHLQILDKTIVAELRWVEERRRIEEQQRAAQAERRRIEEERRAAQAERYRLDELQRRREAESRREFASLKTKYLAHSHKDSSPSSLLYKILLQIETGEVLRPRDIVWLEENRLFATAALYLEKEFERSDDVWGVVKASKYWRRAGKAERAISATDTIVEHYELFDQVLASALYTTRGGAFRDQGDLDQAESCAMEAIKYNPTSFQPYNLLGAISFQRGHPERGDEYFEKALDLGAQPFKQDDQMQAALDAASPTDRSSVADYLLRKDPKRYAWAEFYLDK